MTVFSPPWPGIGQSSGGHAPDRPRGLLLGTGQKPNEGRRLCDAKATFQRLEADGALREPARKPGAVRAGSFKQGDFFMMRQVLEQLGFMNKLELVSRGAARQPMPDLSGGPLVKHRGCFTKKGSQASRLRKEKERIQFWRARYGDKRFHEILREQGIKG